jgi:hypothetical protein
MNVIPMQVFVSLLLVAGSLVLFFFVVGQRDLDHSDRLALAPLEEDDGVPRASAPSSLGLSGKSPRSPQ